CSVGTRRRTWDHSPLGDQWGPMTAKSRLPAAPFSRKWILHAEAIDPVTPTGRVGYGNVSFSAVRWTREIGIRISLGAQREIGHLDDITELRSARKHVLFRPPRDCLIGAGRRSRRGGAMGSQNVSGTALDCKLGYRAMRQIPPNGAGRVSGAAVRRAGSLATCRFL